jgi:hypothetical protein
MGRGHKRSELRWSDRGEGGKRGGRLLLLPAMEAITVVQCGFGAIAISLKSSSHNKPEPLLTFRFLDQMDNKDRGIEVQGVLW